MGVGVSSSSSSGSGGGDAAFNSGFGGNDEEKVEIGGNYGQGTGDDNAMRTLRISVTTESADHRSAAARSLCWRLRAAHWKAVKSACAGGKLEATQCSVILRALQRDVYSLAGIVRASSSTSAVKLGSAIICSNHSVNADSIATPGSGRESSPRSLLGSATSQSSPKNERTSSRIFNPNALPTEVVDEVDEWALERILQRDIISLENLDAIIRRDRASFVLVVDAISGGDCRDSSDGFSGDGSSGGSGRSSSSGSIESAIANERGTYLNRRRGSLDSGCSLSSSEGWSLHHPCPEVVDPAAIRGSITASTAEPAALINLPDNFMPLQCNPPAGTGQEVVVSAFQHREALLYRLERTKLMITANAIIEESLAQLSLL